MYMCYVALFLSPFEVPLCLVFGPPVESYLFLGRFPEFGNESFIHREEHPGSLSDGLKVICCLFLRYTFLMKYLALHKSGRYLLRRGC